MTNPSNHPAIAARMQRRLENAESDEQLQRVIKTLQVRRGLEPVRMNTQIENVVGT